ncbi:MAG TPA: hypothetical protein VFC44_13640 [Candidatus Saccharimonadales bacterium]|nr:hypothetical protein [Candidatus Saccharimonadales bacterium]
MSNRQLVMELLTRLPENTPLDEIAREIDLLAGITKREGVSTEEARKLVEAWASQ